MFLFINQLLLVLMALELWTALCAKHDWAQLARAAPRKSANQYIQWLEKFPVINAGPNTLAGLNAPPETDPPIKHRNLLK